MKFENENEDDFEDEELYNGLLQSKLEGIFESQQTDQNSEIYEKIRRSIPGISTLPPSFGNYTSVMDQGLIAAQNSLQYSTSLTFKEQRSQDNQSPRNKKKESNKILQNNPEDTAMNRDIEDEVIKNNLNWNHIRDVELLNGFQAEKSPNGDTQKYIFMNLNS